MVMEIECAVIDDDTTLKQMIEGNLKTKVVKVAGICPTVIDHFRIIESLNPRLEPQKDQENWRGKGKRKMRRQR